MSILAAALQERLDLFGASAGADLICVEDDPARALSLAGRPLVLLGCGSLIAQPFVRCALDRYDVRGVIDNAAAGKIVGGLTVARDAALADLAAVHPGALAVICAFGHGGLTYFRALAAAVGVPALTLPQALRRAGLLGADEPSDWLRAGHPGVVIDVYRQTLAAGFFRDPHSLAVLRAATMYRLTWNPAWLAGVASPPDDIYSNPQSFGVAPDDWIVDAGAFDGDTLRHLHALSGGRYRRIDCFEPDPTNFAALQASAAAYPAAVLWRAGLWSTSGRLRFDDAGGGGGHGGRVDGAGETEIDVLALDDLTDAPHFINPTFIKMDVEGAELAALRGAARTIAARKPKLALSAYHKPEDLFALPAAIAALRPDYQFRLLHHSAGLFDTVLYAF